MTKRLEFLLGMVALVVAGLAMTTLYLRAELGAARTADGAAAASRTHPP